jgi:hypothetical protein
MNDIRKMKDLVSQFADTYMAQPDSFPFASKTTAAITAYFGQLLDDREFGTKIHDHFGPYSTRNLIREILRRFKIEVHCDGRLTPFDQTIFDLMIKYHVTRIENETADCAETAAA